MSKKKPVPAHVLFGFGCERKGHIAAGECKEFFAYNVPANVEIVVMRCDNLCDVEVEAAVCGPDGEPVAMTAKCPSVTLGSSGMFGLKILNPDGAPLDKMVVACYEAKALPPVVVQPPAEPAEPVDLQPLLDDIAAITSKLTDTEERVAKNEECIAEINAVTPPPP